MCVCVSKHSMCVALQEKQGWGGACYRCGHHMGWGLGGLRPGSLQGRLHKWADSEVKQSIYCCDESRGRIYSPNWELNATSKEDVRKVENGENTTQSAAGVRTYIHTWKALDTQGEDTPTLHVNSIYLHCAMKHLWVVIWPPAPGVDCGHVVVETANFMTFPNVFHLQL